MERESVFSIWYVWTERQVPRSEEENSRLSLKASISDLESNGSIWICPDQ